MSEADLGGYGWCEIELTAERGVGMSRLDLVELVGVKV